MKYKHFLKLLMVYKKATEDFSELNDLGFDFFEGKYKLVQHFESLADTAFSSAYDKYGVDWIWWFVYENEYGHRDWSDVPRYEINQSGKPELIDPDDPVYPACDEHGNSICHSYQSLWDYIEKNHKKSG
jgi:hypothetical protein